MKPLGLSAGAFENVPQGQIPLVPSLFCSSKHLLDFVRTLLQRKNLLAIFCLSEGASENNPLGPGPQKGPLGPEGAPWAPKGPLGPRRGPWGPDGPPGEPRAARAGDVNKDSL